VESSEISVNVDAGKQSPISQLEVGMTSESIKVPDAPRFIT
jgi:hypothetical protein